MMINLRNSILAVSIIFTILFTSCTRKITVEHISDIAEKEEVSGIFYALPQTVISVDVEVTKTEHIKGPYYAFANKYLGLNSVINTNYANYEITDVEISHYVEPDPQQYYLIKSISKSLWKQSVIVNLSESGLLQSINDKNEWNDNEKANYTFSDKEARVTDETFNYLVDANIFEKIDTVIEKIHLDTVTIEKHTLKKTFVEKDDEQKAKDVAEYILKIKEKKFNIISGYSEVPYDKNTIEYMYAELDKLENEYLDLFTGRKITKTNKYRFIYLPKFEDIDKPVPLFKFSMTDGLLTASDTKGEEYNLLVTRKGSSQPLQEFLKQKTQSKRNGIYYRIPEYGKITLTSKDKTKAEAHIIINQFGVVHQIKPSRLQMQFYPNSGAIKSIGIEK